MRDALRTLLVVTIVGFLGLLIAAAGLILYVGEVQATTAVSGRQIVVRGPLLGGVGIADAKNDCPYMKAVVNGHEVKVSPDDVEVVGVRTIALAADCKQIEIIQSGREVQVLLDGVEAK